MTNNGGQSQAGRAERARPRGPLEPPPRSPWRRLLALGLALVLALGGTEAALRLTGRFAPQPTYFVGELENQPSENFVEDPDTGWHMRPGHRFTRPARGEEIVYLSDENGFRTDPELPSPTRELLVVVVGDSQAFGFGVPYAQTFGVLLARELGGARIVNLAQPGFGVDQIGLSLRHQALPREPDLVVVAIFRNDFNRSLQAYRFVEGFNKPTFVLDRGKLRPRTAEDRPGSFSVLLERRTHLFGLAEELGRRVGLFGLDTSWQNLNEALLDRMVADGATADVPLLFLCIPRALGTRFDVLDAWAARTGVAYVDPATTPPVSEDLYLPDRHLTVDGHRWVSACLLAEIERRGLVSD